MFQYRLACFNDFLKIRHTYLEAEGVTCLILFFFFLILFLILKLEFYFHLSLSILLFSFWVKIRFKDPISLKYFGMGIFIHTFSLFFAVNKHIPWKCPGKRDVTSNSNKVGGQACVAWSGGGIYMCDLTAHTGSVLSTSVSKFSYPKTLSSFSSSKNGGLTVVQAGERSTN